MSAEFSAVNIPPSYKQTEAGVIPEDWEVKLLGDLFDFSGGLSASRDQLSMEGYCYLHYGDIHTSNRTFIDVRSEQQEIPKLDISLKKASSTSLLEDGDVVFVDASEDDEGTSRHVVIINKDKIPFISGLHTIVAKSKTGELDHQYRRYCFQTVDIKRQFRFFAVGTKVSGISKTNIARITLPVPPVPEQHAIAESLSDADAFIESLEQLIAKKRQIKQGAMQGLLTGKRRLPGFEIKREYKQTEVGVIPEDWICVESAALVTYFGGNAFKSEDATTSGVRWLKIANVGKRKIDWADTSFLPQSYINNFKAYILQKGDVVMALTRPILDGELKISRITSCDVPCLLNQRVAKVIVQSNADLGFIYYVLQTPHFVDSMNETMAGTDPPNIGSKALGKILVPVPSTVLEQTAINTILSDMGSEITALEEKLAKARQIKQGMMQELLTGRIRLL